MKASCNQVDVAQLEMAFDRIDERSVEPPSLTFAPLLAEKDRNVLSRNPSEELTAEQRDRDSGQVFGSKWDARFRCRAQNGLDKLGAVLRARQRHTTTNAVLPADAGSMVTFQIEPAPSSPTPGPKVVAAHPARDDYLHTRAGWGEGLVAQGSRLPAGHGLISRGEGEGGVAERRLDLDSCQATLEATELGHELVNA